MRMILSFICVLYIFLRLIESFFRLKNKEGKKADSGDDADIIVMAIYLLFL